MPTPIIPDSPEFDLPVELPRSTEPPELWLVRLFGALVLHALLFFGVRLAWAEIAVSQAAAGEGGTIEFVEISETADQSAKPKAEGVAPLTALKPGALNKATIVPDETAPDETAVISPAEPKPSPSPELNPSPEPTNIPSPTNSPLPKKPESNSQKPSVSKSQSVVSPSTLPKPITKPTAPQPSKKSNSSAPNKSQEPVTSQQKLPETPKLKNNKITQESQVQSNFAVTPIVRQSQLTTASAGSIQGADGGMAKLLIAQSPGLTFQFAPELEIKPGTRFEINVRIAVSAQIQQVVDVDGDGQREITILPNSPASQTQQIPQAELKRLVEQVLLDYRFKVEYRDIATTPADVTEWELQLTIGVD